MSEGRWYSEGWNEVGSEGAAVQRVARRTGVLTRERIEALTALGFDWTGSDPLSYVLRCPMSSAVLCPPLS